MRVLYERCCGLDIHQASIAACALSTAKGKGVEETRRFGTMTADLLELTACLKARDIQQVAMESTGVHSALSSALIGRVKVPPALG